MNKFTKILLYAVGIFAVYSLVVTSLNMPIFGGSLIFLLLLACPLMFLFMDHGGHSNVKQTGDGDKQAGSAHQH